MERLGEILKKTPIDTLKANTDTSLDVETKLETASRCAICHGAGFVYLDVPSTDPNFGKAMPCSCTLSRQKAERLSKLKRYSNIGPLAQRTFENLNKCGRRGDVISQERYKKVVEASIKFAEQPEGWLVLLGPHGCGKTHLAAAIANYRLSKGQPALFILIPELLDHLRSTYRPDSDVSYDELFQQIKSSPLLVLDDLGSQATTPWAVEKLYQIINHRFTERLPTVFTSASTLETIEDRLRSRLEDTELSRVFLLEEASPSFDITNGLEMLRHMTFDNFDLKRSEITPEQRETLIRAFHLAKEFAQNPRGWLVLQGGNGCGKTHLAAAIGNYRTAQGWPAFFVTVIEFLDHLRATFNPQSPVRYDELFEKVKNSLLLILDDFGEQTSTPWAQAKLYQLINFRYNAKLPTVFTTFLTLDEIESRGESRMTSRLGDVRLSTVFNINVPDFRVEHPATSSRDSANFRQSPIRRPRRV